MKAIWAVCAINVVWGYSDTYNYEKKNNFGKENRFNIPSIHPSKIKYLPPFDTAQHPSPLPTPKPRRYARYDFQNLTQGIQRKGDHRVFLKKFDHPPKDEGQQVFFRGDYNCILSRLAVDTAGLLPMLLRGGVGYRYFLIVIQAKAGLRMQGRVRAWCRHSDDTYLSGAW